MFHNLQLPPPDFTGLFLLPPVSFGDLDEDTQQDVLAAIAVDKLSDGELIRPSQRTMPMGFTWPVTLSHNATTNIIKSTYSIASNAPTFKHLNHSLIFM